MKKNINLNVISLIILFIGIITYTYSILATGIVDTIPNSTFGILDKMSLWFIPSILLVIISFIIQLHVSNRTNILLIYIPMILSTMIWGVMVFVENYPRTWDAYYSTHIVKILSEYQYIELSKAEGLLTYLQYPGAFVYFDIMHLITDIELISITKLFPLLISFLTPLAMYIFYIKTFNLDPYLSGISTIIFVLLNVYLYTNLSPQGLMHIVFPLYFVIILSSLVDNSNIFSLKVLIILMGLFIVSSHPTTTYMTILLISTLVISLKIRKDIKIVNASILSSNLMYIITIFLFWNIYIANGIFSKMIDNIINSYTIDRTMEEIYQRTIPFLLSQLIRKYFIFVMFITSFFYTIYLYLRKEKDFNIYFIFIIIFVLFSISDYSTMNGTFGERAFLLLIIVSSAVFTNIIYSAKRIKIPLEYMIPLLLIMTITIYSYESRNAFEENLIRGYKFVLDNNDDINYTIDFSRNPTKFFLLSEDVKYYNTSLDIFSYRGKHYIPLKDYFDSCQNGHCTLSPPSIVAMSESSLNAAIRMGYIKEINDFKYILDSNNKIYETSTIAVFKMRN